MVCAYYPGTMEADQEDLKFETSLRSIVRPFLKNKLVECLKW
jgi:hypothetical protein